MMTHQIDIQRFKAAANSSHGTVTLKVDALVAPRRPDDEELAPATHIIMSEADARVLMALLKTQLAAFDGRKARSQR